MTDSAEVDQTQPYCPVCEPERDPLAALLTVKYCWSHEPGRAGSEDGAVQADTVLSATKDEVMAGDNRAWCQLLHRKGVRTG